MKTLTTRRSTQSASHSSAFFGGQKEQPFFRGAAGRGMIQRSPMSEQAEKTWTDTKDKGKIFDLLRTDQAFENSDQDLKASLEKLFKGQPDDLWLAETIRVNGPEPKWSGDLLAERHRRAVAGKWADEPGHIEGKLGFTAKGAAVSAYFFPGQTDNRALILGGVHGSELSGIEVAETLLARLTTGPRPFYSVIIVPTLFPDNAEVARSAPKQIETGENVGRYTRGTESTDHSDDPNRQMPGLGKRYDPMKGTYGKKGKKIEPENKMLLELIDRFRPTRIASLHSNHDLDKAGIYADPRADSEGKALGYDTDRDLALEMARDAKKRGANVPGNQLDGTPNAVYPLDPAAAATGKEQKRETKKGISLGGWGSTAICDPAHAEANRPAMRIITVEMQKAQRVQDEPAAEQAARQAEIGAVADTLREIFLGNTQAEGTEDPCAKAGTGKP